MTIALSVKALCDGASAFSLYAGYAIHHEPRAYQTITKHFPPGHQEAIRHNEEGRVTMARYRYADNSILTFKRRGSKTILTATKAP